MEVILLQRVEKLGQMGDVVKVKDGYARNYLLPQRKALRSTAENKEKFATQKADLVQLNASKRSEAEQAAIKLDGQVCVLLRQASESGQLYGSVTARDIAEAASTLGVKVDRTQVNLDRAIKNLGVHPMRVYLHPEVPTTVKVIVARSEAEAEMQKQALARGETLSVGAMSGEQSAEAEVFFEEGAGPEGEGEGEAPAEAEAAPAESAPKAKKAKSRKSKNEGEADE